jgi:hypothetical protein
MRHAAKLRKPDRWRQTLLQGAQVTATSTWRASRCDFDGCDKQQPGSAVPRKHRLLLLRAQAGRSRRCEVHAVRVRRLRQNASLRQSAGRRPATRTRTATSTSSASGASLTRMRMRHAAVLRQPGRRRQALLQETHKSETHKLFYISLQVVYRADVRTAYSSSSLHCTVQGVVFMHYTNWPG